ncbi:hypothetical protein GCM10011494_36580 [Novosphingobium endophyticum]|uniref:histidine kinase n=1 Tax=Novosphingobium endophyticum TaxID=1955250 RepID=A0A916X752_9SPHN|nr:hypothetical protein GCM10011494_36580 [Novosphingobium endophyticum]
MRRGETERLISPQNLKVEIAAFILILITFVAIPFQDRFTGDSLVITRNSSSRIPYSYASDDEHGKSTVANHNNDPMDWECHIRSDGPGAACGFGYVLDQKGLDFSHFDTIVLDFDYDPKGTKGDLAFSLSDMVDTGKGDPASVPNSIAIAAIPGHNVVRIKTKDLGIDQWWLSSHPEMQGRHQSDFRHVNSVQFHVSESSPSADIRFKINAIEFKGRYISATNWYMMLTGFWVFAIGALLVYRLRSSRREFEARKLRLAEENRVIAEARAAAEAASAAKSQFLANMSHELRTPLNAIIGYAQLIASDSDSEGDRASAVTILESGRHLLEVIGDILDIAKIEAGKLEVAPSCLDLPQFLQSVARIMRLRAEAKGLTLDLNLAPDLPRHIEADGKRLRQILFNLLGNAIKFTEQGTVGMTADITGSGAGRHLRFVVSDTGAGIPEDKLDAIFEPFEQVGTAIDRSGGTGLGLSITRRIVSTLGGSIGASSVIGEGSHFTVEVPLIEVTPGIADDPVLEALSGARVLVAMPAEAVRDRVRRVLEAYGAEVESAADGIETISTAARTRPLAVVATCDMPLLSGAALVARLREGRDGASDPQIVMLAGNISSETRASLVVTGAAQVLSMATGGADIAKAVAQTLANKPACAEADAPLILPPRNRIEQLLDLAREGNLRAISRSIPDLMALGPQYRPFGDRVASLAASYQSKTLLQMLEASAEEAGAYP